MAQVLGNLKKAMIIGAAHGMVSPTLQQKANNLRASTDYGMRERREPTILVCRIKRMDAEAPVKDLGVFHQDRFDSIHQTKGNGIRYVDRLAED